MRPGALVFVLPLLLVLAGCGRLPGARAEAEPPARPEDVLDFHTLVQHKLPGVPWGEWTQWAGDRDRQS